MSAQTLADLAKRLKVLMSTFLPKSKNDVGYSPRQYDKVRAFVLLTHAEIETFLEARIIEEVDRRHRLWETSRTPSVVLMGLLAFFEGERPPVVNSVLRPKNEGKKNPHWDQCDLDARLKMSRTQLHAAIKKNHGIRESFVIGMLLRMGMRLDDIDPDVGVFETFGKMRGALAHNSVRATTVQPDPADCRNQVEIILTKLAAIDKAIAAL